MGLVVKRNVGQSIHVFDNGLTVAVVTFKGHGKIEIDSPKQLTIMRSELLGIEDNPENKYFALGPDPLAAIASIGFTREMTGFARNIYQHETLPIDVRHEGSQTGWLCVVIGERVGHRCDSLESLKDYVLGVALQELRKRGVK